MESQNLVKVVDFAPFLDGSDKQSVGDALLESFKTTGFVYLVNHGLSQDKIDQMFDLSKKFFALSHEQKMLAPHPPSGTHHRGYSAPGVEKVVQHVYDRSDIAEARKRSDVKETFEAGREDDELMPNIWFPEKVLPGFREGCLQFFWDCFEIEKNILRALAIGFELPEEYFLHFHTKPDNQLRLSRYPSVPTSVLLNGELSRIDAHSDFGSMTLLMQDDIGGLEVQDPHSGEFCPVRSIPGSILLNAGDFLMRWSNDTIKSTIHRVRAPPSIETDTVPDRYSIPYVSFSDMETVVDCIPGTWNTEKPKKYEPISVGGYVMRRLAASY
ncbi:thymine dioxygenase [Macrolepiota fuliginosa MF-IS2]|uniref:Thymine dioxygenase n=1 Tax=Macrolepiota fuliginosa MF-IS2 TaxID=1400762 RepID=A0A9P5X9M9_9AGAR|nr:thymine dioxygenase [Macrolepiota fuliginosa MF-IS2]